MAIVDETLLAVFRDEVAETLDQLATCLESLKMSDGADVAGQVDAAFRHAHNLKGAARMVGLEPVVAVTHSMEDRLSVFRDEAAQPPPELLTHMIGALTLIERAVDGDDVGDKALRLAESIRVEGHGDGAGTAIDEFDATGTYTMDPDESDPDEMSATQLMKRSTASENAEAEPEADSDAGSGPAVENAAAGGAATAASVRVDVQRLDSAMQHTGELFSTHTRQANRHQRYVDLFAHLHEAVRTLNGDGRKQLEGLLKTGDALIAQDRQDLHRFGYLTDEISTAMKRVRMLPLTNLGPTWRRIVRESAQDARKSITLDVQVGAIELDKQVLDGLRDPIMHLLRNAVAHGIESADERIGAGKPKDGQVRISAAVHGARVVIEVGDDGRGLDSEKIRAKALENELVDAGRLAGMSPSELYQLVFVPGFTTMTEANQLAGRGVGLDVVQLGLRQLGGDVEIVEDRAMDGATFRLTLPPSLMSIRGLLVRAGKSVVAVPVDNIERSLRIARSDVEQVAGEHALRLDDGEPLKVRWLGAMLGQSAEKPADVLTLVVVTSAKSRIGLVVSEVVGEQEFVTKRLPWNLERVGGVSGAVVLEDGTVGVVLDAGYLVSASTAAGARARARLAVAEEQPATAVRSVLVVDDSLTSRTLERNILEAAGYDVITAKDGEEGWETLHKTPVDLVVSDVEMPRCTGLELAARIRANEALGDMPLILVTSLGSEDAVAAGARVGADEYIVKGKFDQRQLLDAVARLI
ncbi:MAG: hybrid sensor histidine kinase/response regulator [Gammaproteobacteria bacterium]